MRLVGRFLVNPFLSLIFVPLLSAHSSLLPGNRFPAQLVGDSSVFSQGSPFYEKFDFHGQPPRCWPGFFDVESIIFAGRSPSFLGYTSGFL